MSKFRRIGGYKIVQFAIRGFKSVCDKIDLAIKPITVLAGANSSGKSSIMQPLLLLKQTIESVFDSGPMMIDGPNVKFRNASELLSRFKTIADSFEIWITIADLDDEFTSYRWVFERTPRRYAGLDIREFQVTTADYNYTITPDMKLKQFIDQDARFSESKLKDGRLIVQRNRAYLDHFIVIPREGADERIMRLAPLSDRIPRGLKSLEVHPVDNVIRNIIHLPAFRGNPLRDYPMAGVSAFYPGTFENYIAAILLQWRNTPRGRSRIQALNKDLEHLELTSKIRMRRLSDTRTQIEVQRKKARSYASIADVGFGVSQILPVLVALHTAISGQLVYVEQPELHLHPRAQWRLAKVIAEASNRGVRVVVETHSSLLLLGIQTLIAEGSFSPESVVLHWFTLDENGMTAVDSVSPAIDGSIGDWPEDFSDIELLAHKMYLDASEKRVFSKDEDRSS
ncbi:MAG: AAA family ATPase [Promethearchaeota archaeon]